MRDIKIFQDSQALIDTAVDFFLALAEESIAARGLFTVVLSGGSTPKPVYRALGTDANHKRVAWDKIYLFWGDERHVPPDHPDSNYRMVKEQLLQEVAIPAENIHRVPAEMDIRLAACSYEESLREFFAGEWPRFDLVMLGMGEDGHTASLFPHSAGLNEQHRWFIANHAPQQEVWRLTLSKKAINSARNILVLVRGASKARMLKDVLTGPHDPDDKPIQLISPREGRMLWLVDNQAGSQLPPELHA
jgi:6-phosphogluconolactonase